MSTAAEFWTVADNLSAPERAIRPDQLSIRERELVNLVARGHTDTQIAEQLYITVSTVRSPRPDPR